MTGRRRLVALLLTALAGIGVVGLPVVGGAPVDVAGAADTAQFKPGNIITDQLFFNGAAMSAASVQTFLNVRNPNCVAGALPCLKNYRQTTPSRAADAYCTAYAGAANESAATIIAKVGRACGISQRVLLVIMQKEEGLVTASGATLSATRYRSAMGFACPDTAACDSTYYGFFNQVYAAARQYRKYAALPSKYSHRAGVTNTVLFHPLGKDQPACGSSQVSIANQATAGLYNYTPYQPNAAALAAGSGTGDKCSAYGNRNFWLYFTNWFGSTQTAGAGDLADLYVRTGGENGPLGAVTQPVTCGLRNGGCKQGYANGWIYWSKATGARAVLGAIRTLWVATGAQHGPLGYPTQSVSWLADHVGQYGTFENGSIYWSPATGAREIDGPVRTWWLNRGGATGSFGYPTRSLSKTADGAGRYALFQHGSVYWSKATGARGLYGAIQDRWLATGGVAGPLGYPTQSVTVAADRTARYAHFQHGSIYSSPAGSYILTGPVRQLWLAGGADRGLLGAPTSSVHKTADGAGRYATFAHGSIYWSAATGARALLGPIEARWRSEGAEQGHLGYPTWSVSTALDRTAQYAHFQHGSLYSSSAGVRELTGSIQRLWLATGADRGPLGAPTSSKRTTADGHGRFATFAHGSIYWSPTTGTRAMLGPIGVLWTAAGAERGPLGYPTRSVSTARDGRGQYADFQHGSIFWSKATGARVLSGSVKRRWESLGAERGLLGYPVQSVSVTADKVGRYARFQHGRIYWSPTTGARAVRGAFLTAWAATGYEHGRLGYPTREPYAVSGGRRMSFQHGSITISTSTGRATVVHR